MEIFDSASSDFFYRFKAYVSGHPFSCHFKAADITQLNPNRKRIALIADGLSADEIINRLVYETDHTDCLRDGELNPVSARSTTGTAFFTPLIPLALPPQFM